MYYLRNGRHQGGVPKKQHKRILNSAKHFKIEENKLLYRKNIMSNNFLTYPPKNARLDLVMSYHSLGHFSVEATHKRLLERYFWRKMLKDIVFAIDNCMTCLRHNKSKVEHHEAMAISANSIWDSVTWDCTFGYEKTKGGYHGMLVLVDRLSKFPFAYPLKSKESSEINLLFSYRYRVTDVKYGICPTNDVWQQ